MFLKQKRKIEELEASKDQLLTSIAKLKRDFLKYMKERIRTLFTEKTNLLKITTNLKKHVVKSRVIYLP